MNLVKEYPGAKWMKCFSPAIWQRFFFKPHTPVAAYPKQAEVAPAHDFGTAYLLRGTIEPFGGMNNCAKAGTL